MGEITTDLYWDCECKTNYIHSKEEYTCPICQAVFYEQPNSRKIEVAVLVAQTMNHKISVDEVMKLL